MKPREFLEKKVWGEKSHVAWRIVDLCDLLPMPDRVRSLIITGLGVGGFWGPGTWKGLFRP
jgi:hypothetical protein